MFQLLAYLIPAALFLVSLISGSREALIIALTAGAAVCLYSALQFVKDFPRRPLTEFLAGSMGAGILGGSIIQNLGYLRAGALQADAGLSPDVTWDVAPTSLAGLLTLLCSAALLGLGLIPVLRQWVTLPVSRATSADRAGRLATFAVAIPVVAIAVWMVATGIVSIDVSPYSDKASEAAKKLGPIYMIVFGLAPVMPAVLSRYAAEKTSPWPERLLALALMIGAMAAVFVVGRRVFTGSIISAALFASYQRGLRITWLRLGVSMIVVLGLFALTSRIFLAARASQGSDRSVSVGEMIATGQIGQNAQSIDTSQRINSRSAFLGETADLVAKMPPFGVAHGMASLSGAAIVIPDVFWPGKKAFIANDMWDDGKIEGAAGNPTGQMIGGKFSTADIADTMYMFGWVDFGYFAPIWVALQVLLFFGFFSLLAKLSNNNVFRIVNYAVALAFCLVPDATASPMAVSLMRQEVIYMLLLSAIYAGAKAVSGGAPRRPTAGRHAWSAALPRGR